MAQWRINIISNRKRNMAKRSAIVIGVSAMANNGAGNGVKAAAISVAGVKWRKWQYENGGNIICWRSSGGNRRMRQPASNQLANKSENRLAAKWRKQ